MTNIPNLLNKDIEGFFENINSYQLSILNDKDHNWTEEYKEAKAKGVMEGAALMAELFLKHILKQTINNLDFLTYREQYKRLCHDHCPTALSNPTDEEIIDAWVKKNSHKLENHSKNIDLELLSPPGATIIETMEALGIDTPLFCIKMGLTPNAAEDLYNGKMTITEEIANKLENVLNIDKIFWQNLESNYRKKLNILLGD